MDMAEFYPCVEGIWSTRKKSIKNLDIAEEGMEYRSFGVGLFVCMRHDSEGQSKVAVTVGELTKCQGLHEARRSLGRKTGLN